MDSQNSIYQLSLLIAGSVSVVLVLCSILLLVFKKRKAGLAVLVLALFPWLLPWYNRPVKAVKELNATERVFMGAYISASNQHLVLQEHHEFHLSESLPGHPTNGGYWHFNGQLNTAWLEFEFTDGYICRTVADTTGIQLDSMVFKRMNTGL